MNLSQLDATIVWWEIFLTMVIGIDPKNDYAFKFVFGSEQRTDVLVDLLNAVLKLPPAGACNR